MERPRGAGLARGSTLSVEARSRWNGGILVLYATDLLTKFGFGDGDILDDVVETHPGDRRERGDPDEPEDPDATESFEHAVLTRLVRRRLGKLLPDFEIRERMSMSHNPVRLSIPAGAIEESVATALDDLRVESSAEEVLRIADELLADFPDPAR